MPDLRARLVNGVHGAFQQYNVNSDEFCENLAQLVLRNVDDIGPGSFNGLVLVVITHPAYHSFSLAGRRE